MGSYTGLLLIKAYHERRGDKARTKVLVPDSAHGTNPASAAMCGFQVVSIPSDANGLVDLEKLREAAGPDTAALMLTNPNTVGLFDPNILEITRIVHRGGRPVLLRRRQPQRRDGHGRVPETWDLTWCT